MNLSRQQNRENGTHHVFEPVPPEDLPGQVGGPRLHRVPGGLDDALEAADHLELGLEDLLRGHVEEGRVFVDPVQHGRREQHHGPVLPVLALHRRALQQFESES